MPQAEASRLPGSGMQAWTRLQDGWADQPQWRALEIGFGSGLRFLRTWREWKDDPGRPPLLHYVGIDSAPSTRQQVLQAAQADPRLEPLAQLLAAQWFGWLPGFHRLMFEGGRVLLTLCVGEPRAMLREHAFIADSVLLDRCGGPPDLYLLKSIARLCRRGTQLFASAGAMPAPDALRQCGFVAPDEGAPASFTTETPARAVYAPHWQVETSRRRASLAAVSGRSAGRCVVVGGGLAGAAAAASLARRGWQVLVLDAASEPASGASSLPAGLLAPHQSPDDSLLSRLCRSGLRIALAEAAQRLREGEDWRLSGLLSHRADADQALPGRPPEAMAVWSRPATEDHKQLAGLPGTSPALWHEQAAWIKPAALVRAWLSQPGIRWQGNVRVAQAAPCSVGWELRDDHDVPLATAELVVIAAANDSTTLLPRPLVLQPVRGQVSYGAQPTGAAFPPFPVNGSGHFLPGIPFAGGTVWVCGATYDRDDAQSSARAADHAANLSRLEVLLPSVAARLAPAFQAGEVSAWVGQRCASADRRPLVGEIAPGLWVSTAMGSRGLTFAGLCAELIAARLHGEPLPLPGKLARALDVQRHLAAVPAAAAYPD